MPEEQRYLFISDIHGQLEALEKLLTLLHYTPGQDRLIFLGDYIAAEGDNLKTLRYLSNLSQNDGVWVVLGNHDVGLQEQIRRIQGAESHQNSSGSISNPTASPGLEYTEELARAVLSDGHALDSWLMTLPWWYEDSRFIGVHAAIDGSLEDWRDSGLTYFTRGREPFLSRELTIPQTVIFGHTPCNQLHSSFDPWFGPGKIGIDGGAGHDHQLNGLIVEGSSFSWRTICLNPKFRKSGNENLMN